MLVFNLMSLIDRSWQCSHHHLSSHVDKGLFKPLTVLILVLFWAAECYLKRVLMASSAWFRVCWDWHAACCHCKDKPLKKTDFIMCLDWLHHERAVLMNFYQHSLQEGFVTTSVINMIFLSCHHTLIWLSSCDSVHFNYSDYFDIVWAANNNSILFQFIQCRSTLQVMWAEKHAHTSYFYL